MLLSMMWVSLRLFAQRIGTAVVDAHNDARAIVCTPSR